MTHQDVLQVCDADMRIKVYSVVPGFKGKGDRMTVQDAINYEMADRFEIRGSREPMELAPDLEEKYAHEAWMAHA